MNNSTSFPTYLDINTAKKLAKPGLHIDLDSNAAEKMNATHSLIVEKLGKGERLYGINTGFGPMVENFVDSGAESQLQNNLLHQLNANVGPRVEREVVRLTLAIRMNALSKSYSGIRSITWERMATMYNRDTLPIMYKWGSVGASGDLIPLSRIARSILGLEKLENSEGKEIDVVTLLDGDFAFTAKEALAIINGTSYSLAMVSRSFYRLKEWMNSLLYPSIAQYLRLMDESFQHLDERLYEVKSHDSAKHVVTKLKKLTEITHPSKSPGVPQPPYSSRSVVLWMGAIEDRIMSAERILETELNSVDDNPLIFGQDVLHGANFQGTYVTLASEHLTASVIGIANLLERQINRILHKDLNGNFPAFLADEPIGLNSGLQGFQLLVTSLLADMRSKAVLHSASTFPTNQDNQDVVSMSANAALNLEELIEKLKVIIAVYTLIIRRARMFNNSANIIAFDTLMNDFDINSIDFTKGNLRNHVEDLLKRMI